MSNLNKESKVTVPLDQILASVAKYEEKLPKPSLGMYLGKPHRHPVLAKELGMEMVPLLPYVEVLETGEQQLLQFFSLPSGGNILRPPAFLAVWNLSTEELVKVERIVKDGKYPPIALSRECLCKPSDAAVLIEQLEEGTAQSRLPRGLAK
ncbi:MAG: hypothetical protein AAF226_15600, partial [Verrucomicrobiota bacterium]